LEDIELRLISELMKNSRRSDKELAKALAVSTPTVSRTIHKLEKDGVIKEYTIIPDFAKLGLSLVTMTFVKLKEKLSRGELAKAENLVKENLKKTPYLQMVMAERGLGFSYDTVIVSIEKNYSDYAKLLDRIKSYPHIESSQTQSFMIDLGTQPYFPFTFQTLAKYLLTMQKGKSE
jgi:DNA-binding Lrp family transcriptional regulator